MGFAVERLAGHHRQRDPAADLRQPFHVFRVDRLLVPERRERLEAVGDTNGFIRREAAMDLDQDLDVGTDSLAHRAYSLDRDLFLRSPDMRPPRVVERVELERGKAALDHVARALGELLRRAGSIRPAVGIHANAIAAGSTEQVVHRLATRLADDIPQRLFQRAQCRPEVHRWPSQRVVQVHH